MNKVPQNEENLSDEFLDEHVCVSSVKKLSHLEENMTESPFHSEVAFNNFHKASTVKMARDSSDDLSMQKKSAMTSIPFHSEKVISEISPCKHTLQGDIKDLLHQVMDMRKRSHYHLDVPEKLEQRKRDGNSRRKSYVREVTMKDIQKPDISD
ncbi:unnamed protein product [Moneuplotes crassus]|uniref:Uncharacterized protein n=1 Tax=Euplotes crassus TaxID=5936 RepID=A0AAD1UF28_EUPCR|nr:unnamed protein product [Moneuplotes crassus]